MSDSDQNIDRDYEFSRQVYYEIISKGLENLDRAADVADQTQHPRAYEVVGNMIKQIADTNEKLMALNKAKKELAGKLQPKSETVNNNLIMTTADLQRLLLNPPKEIDVTPKSD